MGNKGMVRTHKCAEIKTSEIGSKVTVMGWVNKRRDLGGVIFIDLRDISGVVQVVFNNEINHDLHKEAEHIRNEYVIAISGEVVMRDEETVNNNIATGEIEIVVDTLSILSEADTPPVPIEENTLVNEATRLKYRYLDLRRPDMQKLMITRHKIAQSTREFFNNNEFMEIETPMLTKSTPEGARDYLVPSRVHPGSFYALPQSPQIFKQLLMVSGFDRYYQIVKCFRDEDLRADRQPEFTQIDVEMSFVDVEQIININEKFIQKLYKDVMGEEILVPFERITWQDAMDRFGSDKPDMRFGMEICDLSDIVKDSGFKVFSNAVKNGGSVRAINAKGCGEKFARREIDALADYVKTYRAKGMAWIAVEEDGLKSVITKFMKEEEINEILENTKAEPGDLICFIADTNKVVYDSLGHLRLKIAEKLDLLDSKEYKFVWVTEFPLLEYDDDDKRWVAKHHPFTSPMDEDLELLETDPGKIRAKAYDIVLNGSEIGGGSIRIHDRSIQQKMFNLLGFEEEEAQDRFGFLLDAFKYGTPPHGGIAYGLDRIVMLLTECTNIRDVIAFPKVQNASCPLSNAPDVVEVKQLKELQIVSKANLS